MKTRLHPRLTNVAPENRQGTKSFAKYNQFCGLPAGISNQTARNWNKARKLCFEGVSVSDMKGRRIRALARHVYSCLHDTAHFY